MTGRNDLRYRYRPIIGDFSDYRQSALVPNRYSPIVEITFFSFSIGLRECTVVTFDLLFGTVNHSDCCICALNSVRQRDMKGEINNSSLSVADRSARLQRKRHQWRQLQCVGRFIDKCSWPRLFSSYSSNGSVHCKIFLSCGFSAANLS